PVSSLFETHQRKLLEEMVDEAIASENPQTAAEMRTARSTADVPVDGPRSSSSAPLSALLWLGGIILSLSSVPLGPLLSVVHRWSQPREYLNYVHYPLYDSVHLV